MTAILTPPTATRAAAGPDGLLQRLIPERAAEFRLELIDGEQESFELSGGGDEPVTVRATTKSALTAGFNWYLKHHCHAHVSWCGSRVELPERLPIVNERIAAPYKYRYDFNYCTFSYSMAFWDWARWEREIDWMALAGINIPLAVTGQEIVWQRVYRELGLSDEEISSFLAGPAFLAWGWMGNLDGWGGPSPQSWIDGQCALQKKILARQRELGIKPVLPAFTGHVPAAIAKKFPGAKIKQMKNWAETFAGTFILDPSDPLFQKIGHAFIKEQRAIYGVDPGDGDHLYSCDTFNENSPPDNDPAYLRSIGQAIYRAMADVDPKAVWVLQDWMFFFNPTDPDFWKQPQIEAFLTSVPDDRLLVLDLHSEGHPLWQKTQSLCGKPWVWCCLHSFGGHQSMHGNMGRVANDPPAALADPTAGQLVGFGLTMEGIDQNPALYDLATDMMWRREAPDLDDWLAGYVHRRYGVPNVSAIIAWRQLRDTVYSRPGEWSGVTATMVNLPPRLSGERVAISYSPHQLVDAWRTLADAAGELGDADCYRYDLVDVGRQVMDNLASTLHTEVAAAYASKDPAALKIASRMFLELLDDLDSMLATRKEFLLGRWLQAARAWGTNDAERRLMEFNARAQITLWHDRNSFLRDYARKEWAGMIRGYYRVRWERYFEALTQSLESGLPVDDKGFHKELRLWEEDWDHQTDDYPTEPTGDSVQVALAMLAKYTPVFASAYRVHTNLATGKPVTASTDKPGNAPERAVTGYANRTSYWAAEPGPQWLCIDLLQPTKISSVHVLPFWDGTRSYRYTVDTSLDGTAWETIVDAGQNLEVARASGDHWTFLPHTARFVRVTMLGSSAGESVHLLDLRIYG